MHSHIYDQAADYIAEHGLSKHIFINERGGVCIRGALNVTAGWHAYDTAAGDQYARVVTNYMGMQSPYAYGNELPEWNNAPERTDIEVIAVLRGVAAQEREKGDGIMTIDIAELADRAADYIEQHGHAKGVTQTTDGRVCLVGAVDKINGIGCGVLRAVEEYLDIDYPCFVWNNAPERTPEEVISVLRDVATKRRSDEMRSSAC